MCYMRHYTVHITYLHDNVMIDPIVWNEDETAGIMLDIVGKLMIMTSNYGRKSCMEQNLGNLVGACAPLPHGSIGYALCG